MMTAPPIAHSGMKPMSGGLFQFSEEPPTVNWTYLSKINCDLSFATYGPFLGETPLVRQVSLNKLLRSVSLPARPPAGLPFADPAPSPPAPRTPRPESAAKRRAAGAGRAGSRRPDGSTTRPAPRSL